MEQFAAHVVKMYRYHYLRPLNKSKTNVQLLRENALGVLGMLGSINCCNCVRKNCSTACSGQYKGKKKFQAVIMAAIAGGRL